MMFFGHPPARPSVRSLFVVFPLILVSRDANRDIISLGTEVVEEFFLRNLADVSLFIT